jgi:hypothetical protein
LGVFVGPPPPQKNTPTRQLSNSNNFSIQNILNMRIRPIIKSNCHTSNNSWDMLF